MKRRFGALTLSICMLLLYVSPALAAQLGPARSYDELLSLAQRASGGDTLLISGAIAADSTRPLKTQSQLILRGAGSAVSSISDLALEDANVVLSNLLVDGGLRISGISFVQLERGVTVQGAQGRSGIEFTGSGALLLDPGSCIGGGQHAPGVRIAHHGGDLYISIDGSVQGGRGETGGAAVEIDPLGESGALMVTGQLTGGQGDDFGGNALNLHNLGGNAYITVDGRLTGGEGSIGGSGLQLITANGSIFAGLGGQITGGSGKNYGGDAMLLMNVDGSASIALSGHLTGGNSTGPNSTPGQSLKLLGRTTAMRTTVGDCILQDGRQVLSAIAAVTPLPAITSSVDDVETAQTPAPTQTPQETQQPESTPAPEVTAEPTVEPTAEPTAEPTEEPTVEPTAEPTAEPTEEPTVEPTAESTAEPTEEPTAEPTAEPTPEPTAEPV